MTQEEAPSRSRVHEAIETYFRLAPVTVPIYALILAMAVGSIIVIAAGSNPLDAYAALVSGVFGTPARFANALARSTPFIFTALAVAICYRAGLFNIGAEGQLLIGGVTGTWVAGWAMFTGWPALFAISAGLIGGVIGGAIYGFIPGFLKAKTGAHEVIVTIMLNLIALLLLEWLIGSRNPPILVDPEAAAARTEPVVEAARLPSLYPGTSLHAGFLVAIALCVLVWYLIRHSRFGFEVRTIGSNPAAARYAGMSVSRTTMMVFLFAGALAGLGAAADVQGSSGGYLTPGRFQDVGFDGIAIALIARANPLAVIPAAILWGSLLAGAGLMQVAAGISIDLVRIIQALIILFVAADMIVRTIFRIRKPRGREDTDEPLIAARGWEG
ncbi:ABC transporter permease [Egibacter rhizosphaerae]|uniref:ABC transporter permease n=1 Tax=Egibacter rhizosphaerae TaxID=1670831 RepID=A0A411YIT3_9ACTN|nr:ABC transporter permease [Egibacter rhizosphaerae]QBI21178.1 ABC transporter permease [Egibacter rhizosphaerae]